MAMEQTDNAEEQLDQETGRMMTTKSQCEVVVS